MVRYTRMCWVELGGCGRKQVLYRPNFPSKSDKNPYECSQCHKRYSAKQLGIKKVKYASIIKSNKRVYQLSKDLRQHCINTSLEQRRLHYD
jgi:hypothetical protein